nr:hypothetical protein [Tanacetum cinerariifolium]
KNLISDGARGGGEAIQPMWDTPTTSYGAEHQGSHGDLETKPMCSGMPLLVIWFCVPFAAPVLALSAPFPICVASDNDLDMHWSFIVVIII